MFFYAFTSAQFGETDVRDGGWLINLNWKQLTVLYLDFFLAFFRKLTILASSAIVSLCY